MATSLRIEVLRLSLLLPGMVVLCACTESAEPLPAAVDVAVDTGPGCPEWALRPDGSCCDAGTWFDVTTSECASAGPAACGATVLSDPATCTPRWCWDWRDATGAECDAKSVLDCAPAGRLCTADELAANAGCAAGWWPSPLDGGACVPAGYEAGRAKDLGEVSVARGGVPVKLPPVHIPRWCWNPRDSNGDACSILQEDCDPQATVCGADQVAKDLGCPAGQAPPLGKPGTCAQAGLPWTCPPGFIVDENVPANVGTMAPCLPDPGDCGDAKWRPATAGKMALYVDASASPGGTGSQAAPYASLGSAMSVAPDGAELLVAAGVYKGYLHLKKRLHIRGRCAAQVRLVNTAKTAALVAQQPPSSQAARIDRLTIESTSHEAVVVNPGRRLHLERVHIAGAGNAGVVVGGAGARLQMTRSVIAEVKPAAAAASQWSGSGIVILADAHATLVDVRVHRCRGAGIGLLKPGARLLGQRLACDETRSSVDKTSCPGGLAVMDGAQARVMDLRLSHNADRGATVQGKKGLLIAAGVLVQDTIETPGLDGVKHIHGRGLDVYEGASLAIYGARIARNALAGVGVTWPGSRATMVGVVAEDNQPTLSGDHGVGVTVGGGAQVELLASRIVANHALGLMVAREDARLVTRSVVVEGTLPRKYDGLLGYGVSVTLGGRLTWLGGRLVGNRTAGASVRGAGSEAMFAGVLADGQTMLEHGPGLASGLFVAQAGKLIVAGARSSGNGTAGILSFDAGSALQATGVLVSDNAPHDAKQLLGAGCWVNFPGDLTCDGCLAMGNHAAAALSQAGNFTARHSVFRATQAGSVPDGNKTTTLAEGVAARLATSLRLEYNLLHNLPRAGVMLHGGEAVELVGNVSTGNQFGIVADANPALTAKQNLYFGNNQNKAFDEGLAVVPPPSPVELAAPNP